jgi:hypothetical protein
VPITEQETMLEVLKALDKQDAALKLSTKDYPDMGTLILAMNNQTNGTEKKYWQYKVNGVMPQIGAGSYKLHNGDSVEWFFTTSQQ